jgi:hypothetical protein
MTPGANRLGGLAIFPRIDRVGERSYPGVAGPVVCGPWTLKPKTSRIE